MKNRWFSIVLSNLLSLAAISLLLLLAQSASLAAAPDLNAPTITGITPVAAPNDLDTPVVVNGSDFAAILSGTEVLTLPAIYLGDTPLQDIVWVNSTTLSATLPWGLDVGVYSLTVVNPDHQVGFLASAFTVTQGIGVWQSGEFDGGRVDGVAISPDDPQIVYAWSFYIGLFRSLDGGNSWEFILSAHPTENLVIDPLHPERIYVRAEYFYLRSEDRGDTWTPLGLFPVTLLQSDPVPCNIMRVYPHPAQAGVLYGTLCADPGVFRSEDYGATWLTASQGLSGTQVTNLAYHPDDPDILFVSTLGDGIFRSQDGGGYWEFVSHPMDAIGELDINPFGAHELWVTGHKPLSGECQMARSTNPEMTEWQWFTPTVDLSCFYSAFTFHPTISGTVYLVDSPSGFVSEDGGETWQPFGPDPEEISQGLWIQAVSLYDAEPDLFMLADLRAGIYRSDDGGLTWEVKNGGLTAMAPTGLAAIRGAPQQVIATFDYWPGPFLSYDGGGTWRYIHTTENVGGLLLTDPFTPTRVYAMGCVISEDGGETWPIACSLPSVPTGYGDIPASPYAFAVDPHHPGHLLTVGRYNLPGTGLDDTEGVVFRSVDAGLTWFLADLPEGVGGANAVAYDPGHPNVAYMGTGALAGPASGLYRSMDDGLTWQRIGADVPALDQIMGIAVEPVTPYRIIIPLWGGYSAAISGDQGETWELLLDDPAFGRPLVANQPTPMLFTPGAHPLLYVSTLEGLRYSPDAGTTWYRAPEPLGSVQVFSLAAASEGERVILYAGTTGGAVSHGALRTSEQGGSQTLVEAGVYRLTRTVTLQRLYLPLVRR